MLIQSKGWSIAFIVLGVIIALSNGYLYLSERTTWSAIMFLVGVGWIFVGVSNLRRLQKTNPK